MWKTFEICDACSQEDITRQSLLSIPFDWKGCAKCGSVTDFTQPIDVRYIGT